MKAVTGRTSIFICWSLAVVFTQSSLIKADKFDAPERFHKSRESILDVDDFDNLMKKYNPVNLGQGFPDFQPAEVYRKAYQKVAFSEDVMVHQYTKDNGHPPLLNAVAKYFSKVLNRTLDPQENVFITEGATEALYLTFQTFTFPGDEWIVFEPFYSPYIPIFKAANAVVRYAPLRPKRTTGNVTSADWVFDKEEVANLFNEKTKGILFNNPHNPLGKVFTLEEIEFIAEQAKKWNVLVVADEVYQFMVYGDKKHIRIGSLPGMFERTITVSSGGKIFGATGHRLGWAYGGAKVIKNLRLLHIKIMMSCPTPIQEAFALALNEEYEMMNQPGSHIHSFKYETVAKRDRIVKAMRQAGMTPIVPDSGYFIVSNFTSMGDRVELDGEAGDRLDSQFSNWMIKNMRIMALPMSNFFNKDSGNFREDLMRFSFVKKDETLDKVVVGMTGENLV